MVRQNDKHLTTPYYCAFEYRPSELKYKFYAVIWRYGGAINGAHQPMLVIDIIATETDVRRSIVIEHSYPGIDYAPYPQVIDGRLYP